MFEKKRNWMVVVLVVAFLIISSSAQAQELFRWADDAIMAAQSGQVYDAVNAGNAYGDWEIATIPTSVTEGGNGINWWSVGTDVGQGITGMSTDTPDGSNFSIYADAQGYSTAVTYAVGYTVQTGFTAGDYFLSYDIKGDFYTNFASVGNSGDPSTGHNTSYSGYNYPSGWVHVETVITVTDTVDGFSFYLYDHSANGNAAYMDNLSLTPYVAPTGPSSMFYNSDMELGGYIYGPGGRADGWGDSSPGVVESSFDVPIPGGGSQSLSILSEPEDGNTSGYTVAYTPAGSVTELTEYELNFWHKGDVYLVMPGTDYAGWASTGNPYEWMEETLTITTDAGMNDRVSLYFYDIDSTDGLPVLIDNVHFALPAVAALLEGDANRDGVVSAGDYASVQANFGSTGEAGILGDANGDGVVSAGDYASVQANFGATAGPVLTPEPATMTLITLGGLALIRRRK